MILVLAWSGGSMADPDVWWHVRTGRWILDNRSVPHTDPWSFTAPQDGWVPTAWLSDVLFASAWHVGGFDGVRVVRVLLAVLVTWSIWLVARQYSTHVAVAAGGTALALLAVAPFLRERPQVISYLFVAWLAVLVQRVLDGLRPPLLAGIALTFLWANLHGMWVLAPVGILGAGVLAWCSDRSRVPLAARCTTIALVGWASAFLTPAGPRLGVWPIVVQRVAAPITEWQRTVPLAGIALPFALILVLILVRWARAGSVVPWDHVIFVLAVAVFGLMAFRNVAPAAILLLPELVRPLTPATAGAKRLSVVPRGGVVAVSLGVVLATMHLATSPTASTSQPTRIADDLSHRSEPLRVLNAYDVGGLLTGTASPPVRVAIDGRTDMWSSRFVRDYLNAVSGAGDWRALVDVLAPDAAVLPKDSEVSRGLVRERGWRVTLVDGSWELLEPRR